MSNNNPLRIFNDREIGQLLVNGFSDLKIRKLSVFNDQSESWDYNNHIVSKNEVENIFELLENNLLDTIALYRYQSLPNFIDGDDIKLFQKLHKIPFEEMDPDISGKMYDLIANKVNILLPKQIVLKDPDKGIVSTISTFFQNLSPKHNHTAFNATYDSLDAKVGRYIKKYPKPFNNSFLKGNNRELSQFIKSDTYELLKLLPNMFEPIRSKYGKWLAEGMNKVMVLEGRPPTRNYAALSALSEAANVAKEYNEPAKNTTKAKILARQCIQLKGGSNESKSFSKFIVFLATASFFVAAFFCYKYYFQKTQNGTNYSDTQKIEILGPRLKYIADAKSYQNMYPNPDYIKLATILGDYLGAHPRALNPKLVSNEDKGDYVELQFEVDALPIDYKNIEEYLDTSISKVYPGESRDVIANFTVSTDKSVYSSNTLKVEFPRLLDTWLPNTKYGYEPAKGGMKPKSKIKKLKAKEFNFEGSISHYYVGAHIPYKVQDLNLWYELAAKSYMFRGDDITPGKIDVDLFKEHKINKGDVIDEYRFASIVNNIKLVQNKVVKKGGFYQLADATHTVSNIGLQTEYPLREVVFEDALLMLKGTSIADGNTYVKIIMDYSQVGLMVDINGYIKQYQQVTIDKARGVVEKIVLIRK